MSQQGGARNLGPARVAVALGLIQVSPSEGEGEFRLGRTERAYNKVSGDTCLEALLAAASGTSAAWQVARTADTPGEVVRGILEVFAALTACGLRGLRVTGDDSYMRLFFVRMVLLARMAEGSAMIENPKPLHVNGQSNSLGTPAAPRGPKSECGHLAAWGSPSCGRRLVARLDRCESGATPGHGA